MKFRNKKKFPYSIQAYSGPFRALDISNKSQFSAFFDGFNDCLFTLAEKTGTELAEHAPGNNHIRYSADTKSSQ
jgi:hypothetical protein